MKILLFNFYQDILIILFLCASFGHTAQLWLYCGSLNNYTATELNNPLPLLYNTCFDETLHSIFYAFGFNTTPDDEVTQVVIQSYITLGTYNVFLINWQEEASSELTILNPIMYPAKAVPNTIKVGKMCGKALDIMSNYTLDLNKTHGAGHSLGAHLMGYCGKELQNSNKIKINKSLSSITGLDPAGPGFQGPVALHGLDKSCGKCVIVYHTNPLVFGTADELGHKDIWFNCNKKYQPKCDDASLSTRDKCSHLLACNYHAEAVLDPTAFAAAPSGSCSQWQAQDDSSATYIYVNVDTDCTGDAGNFYLSTNAQSPYGRGLGGLYRR